ncbi:type II 3-dehydroquinate dehydratase [Streptomyces sp. NPDC000395]|uniref:type II 3-dehydroquinate dehydratase n=2 Tax=unclassified Streptomyces TaxID=2593676 RepID=UPI003369D713
MKELHMFDATTENAAGRTILFLNGPNLNLLGVREPDKYGSTTLREVEETVAKTLSAHGLTARFVQSNHEGVLVDAIHAARTECGAIVINPAAFTHTSVALRDAIAAVALPTIELHITNVHKREEFRHHSYISAVADAVIVGAGTHGYVLAALHVAHLLLG